MRSKTKYLPLSDFIHVLTDLIDHKKSFQSQETTYTKKIKYKKDTFIFNEDGEGDFSGLHLINLVRGDAKKFLENNKVLAPESVKFFELTEKPPTTVISKVDIRAAYWSYAMQNKIILKSTDDFLNEKYDCSEKLKKARLRALGSLATKKVITDYFDGDVLSRSLKEENTRDLYMHICKGIDLMMMEMAYTISGAFYYYWDCVFASENATQKVRSFIEKAKYHSTVKTTRTEVIDVGEHKYLFSKSDEKMYLIRPENKILLGNI